MHMDGFHFLSHDASDILTLALIQKKAQSKHSALHITSPYEYIATLSLKGVICMSSSLFHRLSKALFLQDLSAHHHRPACSAHSKTKSINHFDYSHPQ